MKNRYVIYILVLLFIGLSSCSEDSLDTFHGKNGIHFSVGKMDRINNRFNYVDSTDFSFIKYSASEHVLPIRIAALGEVMKIDRKINFSVVGDSTTAELGKHYELSYDVVIPADSIGANINVMLKRDTSLANQKFKIYLKLENNEHFIVTPKQSVVDEEQGEYVDLSQHSIVLYDMIKLPKDEIWFFHMEYGNADGYFGHKTVPKYRLINEACEITQEDWDRHENQEPGSYPQEISIWGGRFRKFLQAEFDAGRYYYEDETTKELIWVPKVGGWDKGDTEYDIVK